MFPGLLFFREYLIFTNPNTKNSLYKKLKFNKFYKNIYGLNLSSIKNEITRRKHIAESIVFYYSVGLTADVYIFIAGLICMHYFLIVLGGSLSFLHFYVLLNQLNLLKRLYKVEKKYATMAIYLPLSKN